MRPSFSPAPTISATWSNPRRYPPPRSARRAARSTSPGNSTPGYPGRDRRLLQPLEVRCRLGQRIAGPCPTVGSMRIDNMPLMMARFTGVRPPARGPPGQRAAEQLRDQAQPETFVLTKGQYRAERRHHRVNRGSVVGWPRVVEDGVRRQSSGPGCMRPGSCPERCDWWQNRGTMGSCPQGEASRCTPGWYRFAHPARRMAPRWAGPPRSRNGSRSSRDPGTALPSDRCGPGDARWRARRTHTPCPSRTRDAELHRFATHHLAIPRLPSRRMQAARIELDSDVSIDRQAPLEQRIDVTRQHAHAMRASPHQLARERGCTPTSPAASSRSDPPRATIACKPPRVAGPSSEHDPIAFRNRRLADDTPTLTHASSCNVGPGTHVKVL